MRFIRLTVVPLVSILLFGFETGMAELWICPGTEGTEAFTDQGGQAVERGTFTLTGHPTFEFNTTDAAERARP